MYIKSTAAANSCLVFASNSAVAQNADWVGPFTGPITGPGFGAFAGYNMQKGRIVCGVEVEAAKLTGSSNFTGVPGPGALDAQVDWAAGLRGRVGFDNGNILPYAFVGANFAHLDVTAVGFSTQEAVHKGFSFGAGVDAKIGEKVFGRVELNQSNYSEQRYLCLQDLLWC